MTASISRKMQKNHKKRFYLLTFDPTFQQTPYL
jgi:hypothetical protein